MSLGIYVRHYFMEKAPKLLRFKGFRLEAGDEIRTHDIDLGKVALYH